MSGYNLRMRAQSRERQQKLLALQEQGACSTAVDDTGRLVDMVPDHWDEVGVAAAKAVCNGCDVRAACLEYALRWREDAGVYGGVDEKERAEMRRRRPAVVRATG